MDTITPLPDLIRSRNELLDDLRIQHPFLPIIPGGYSVRSYRFTGTETGPVDIRLPAMTKMILIRCSPYMITDNDVYCNLHGTASDMSNAADSTMVSGDNTFMLDNSLLFHHVENLSAVSINAVMNSGVVSVFCFIQG